jgi:hypothetical protein
MFGALLAHLQEALHKQQLVYFVRVMSAGCYQGWSGTAQSTKHYIHSWTTCLQTESFLQPFGLHDLWISLSPNFSPGCDEKQNSVYSNNPHIIDDLKMTITEGIRNVDRAILNTVFVNTLRRVSECLETGGGRFEHYL